MSKMNTDYLIKLTSDKSRSMSGKGIENILEYADINKLKKNQSFSKYGCQNYE